ncbi:MAG: TIM44-like domain-containing protein [Candidatus Ozemobacteraceae bacterium]
MPDTRIEMADGTSRPISLLRPGDRLRTRSLKKGAVESTVIERHDWEVEGYLELTTSHGTVRVTRDHLFALPGGNLLTAGSLKPGMMLLSEERDRFAEARVNAIRAVDGPVRVYNVLTDWPQSYFAESHLVHNKGCFVPETLVQHADGTETPISDIKPGDSVRAFKLDGTLVKADVMRVFHVEAQECFEVQTESGISIKATAEHPFYIGSGAFRIVEVLKPGDEIVIFKNGLTTDRVRSVVCTAGKILVYNIETDQPNTFIAGGVAVHNKGGFCFAAGTAISLPDGTTKAIEKLVPGDEILGGDGRPTHVRLSAIARDELVQITSPSGSVQTTREHPFLLGRGAFRPAYGLGTRSFIRRADRSIERITHIAATGVASFVYQIQVDEPHTFVAAGFIVHNKGGGGWSSSRSSSRSYRRGSGGGTPMTAEDLKFVGIFLGVIFIGGVGVIAYNNKFGEGSGSGGDLDEILPVDLIAMKAKPTEQLVRRITERHPEFSPEALQETIRHAFMTLQKVWQSRNYADMAPLVFPDLRRDHEQQLQSSKRNHEINMIESPQITRVDMVHVNWTDKVEDRSFSVLISARAKDYYIDDRSRAFIRGDSTSQPFQEFWTFQSRSGRWLLREIEQVGDCNILREPNVVEGISEEEMKSLAGAPVPGGSRDKVATLIQNYGETGGGDIWNERALKDLARTAAIALHAAFEANEASGLAGIAGENLLADIEASLADARERGEHREFRNLCVRRVDLVMARPASGGRPHEFTARVTLHAQRVTSINDQRVSGDADVGKFDKLFHFQHIDGSFRLTDLPDSKGDSAGNSSGSTS